MIQFFKNFFKSEQTKYLHTEEMNLFELIHQLETQSMPIGTGNKIVLAALKEINKRLFSLENPKID